MDNSNKNQKKPDLHKVEEPITEYSLYSLENNVVDDSELHPILIQLLEKSVNQAEAGEVFSHEEAMRRINEKIRSLK